MVNLIQYFFRTRIHWKFNQKGKMLLFFPLGNALKLINSMRINYINYHF
jgi:hypothetical protein